MSPFVVLPATPGDLPILATISGAAFKHAPHTMSYWIYLQSNDEATYNWRLQRIRKCFHNEPYCSFEKCVDTATDQVVAFALWEKPHAPKRKAGEESAAEEKESSDVDVPEGTNVALRRDFDAETQRMRKKYVDCENDYLLRAIATLPEYQGRGCGSALLEAGLERVDDEGRKAFLEATPQGRSLYVKFGWRDVDEIVLDLTKYGLNAHVQCTTCMMREPMK